MTPDHSPRAEGGRAPRVLIVDDDPEDVDLTKDLLEKLGPDAYTISAAHDFEEGLRLLEVEGPDLCLVDHRLGARSGVEFILEAAAIAPHVPAVLLAGAGSSEVDRTAMQAGAVDFLAKADLTAERLEHTVRYALERARRQRAEARFRALIENSHDLISIIAPDGTLEFVSPALNRILGFDPRDKSGSEAVLEVHPDDRERVQEELGRIMGGEPEEGLRTQYRVRHRDGSWRDLDTIATNHLHDPSIRGVVVHSRDITEQVSTREWVRFQADLLSAVGQAVVATDLQGTVLFWNPAAERIYGWTREEAVGRDVLELARPDMTRLRTGETMAVLEGGRTWSGEVEVVRKDGSTFAALVTGAPIAGSGGVLEGFIAVSSDISSLKETEDALRERVKELRTLHETGSILNDTGLSADDRLQRVTEGIPRAWPRPDFTEARLVVGEREFTTRGFREMSRMLSAPVVSGLPEEGRLDVALTDSPEGDGGGSFLREKQDLIQDLAGVIGDMLKRECLGRTHRRTVAALDEAVLVVRGRTILDANPAAERMFGYGREELIGATTEKLHVDRDRFDRFGELGVSALEGAGVFRHAYPLRRSDGTVFQAEQTVSILHPDEGLAGGAVSVIRDVSSRVRAEAELRASEERFREMAESIDDVFWISNPDRTQMEYVSPSFSDVWGRPVDELLANPGLLVDAVLPGDRPRVVAALPLQQQDGTEMEYRILRPDGEVRWIFDRTFPVRENGRVVRIIGVAEDITDRKLAEERFTVLGQEVADGIYVIAPDGRILFATPAVQTVLGHPPREIEGRSALDLVHPDDRPAFTDALAGIMDRPGEVAQIHYRGLTREGDVRHLESLGRDRTDHPAIRGVVVTTRDVTERHGLEDRVRQSQKLEAIGRLAGGIAHDFNNLLTVIRSQTDLLLIDMEDTGVLRAETATAELETIQTAADRAAALTSQLLAFSREQVLQPRVVNLSDVVRHTVRLLERVIGEDVALHADLAEDLPSVLVDPGQLEHVIMNLAVNARDAMPRGGTLTLRTRREDGAGGPPGSGGRESGDRVVLEVADTGIGMDAETRSRIFEPFFTTKEKGKGTGLGLAMVYGVVGQSGGAVRVDSEPGEGSTFILGFPAVDGQPEERKPLERLPGAHEALHARLLVVEDDDAVRRVVIRILERVGMEVVAVATAEEGVEALAAGGAFDLLLTDLVLPGMSGRALVDVVQEGGHTLPVIVMSGYTEDSPGERSDLPEEIPFVQKPFTPEGLVRVVRGVLGHG